jgi:site-specific DNA recombinase
MPSSPRSSSPAVAVHARYSSDLQRENSIDDQLHIREKHAAEQAALVAERDADQPIARNSLIRPRSQRARPFPTLTSH